MKTHSDNNNNNHDESHSTTSCRQPEVGAQLPAYIVDLLDDAEAFRVEQHLVQCKHCKERYLSVLRVKSEASRKQEVASPENGAAVSNEKFWQC